MIEILAQATPTNPEWWTGMVVQGAVGTLAIFMLKWFMVRAEVRIKAVEVSNDRMSRTNLLLVIALRQANEAVKTEAREMLKDLDNEQEKARNEK